MVSVAVPLLEPNVLVTKPPNIDENDWPEIELADVSITTTADKRQSERACSLLDAGEQRAVRVTGRLQLSDDQQHLLKRKGTKNGTFIELPPVTRYAYGQYDDGEVVFWALGGAGWFRIVAAESYESQYKSMLQAVRMLYFLTDAYRPARNRKSKPRKVTVSDLFARYSKQNPDDAPDGENAAELFYSHNRFLINCMIRAAEGFTWERTSIWDHMRELFPREFEPKTGTSSAAQSGDGRGTPTELPSTETKHTAAQAGDPATKTPPVVGQRATGKKRNREKLDDDFEDTPSTPAPGRSKRRRVGHVPEPSVEPPSPQPEHDPDVLAEMSRLQGAEALWRILYIAAVRKIIDRRRITLENFATLLSSEYDLTVDQAEKYCVLHAADLISLMQLAGRSPVLWARLPLYKSLGVRRLSDQEQADASLIVLTIRPQSTMLPFLSSFDWNQLPDRNGRPDGTDLSQSSIPADGFVITLDDDKPDGKYDPTTEANMALQWKSDLRPSQASLNAHAVASLSRQDSRHTTRSPTPVPVNRRLSRRISQRVQEPDFTRLSTRSPSQAEYVPLLETTEYVSAAAIAAAGANSDGDVWRCQAPACRFVVYAASTLASADEIRNHATEHEPFSGKNVGRGKGKGKSQLRRLAVPLFRDDENGGDEGTSIDASSSVGDYSVEEDMDGPLSGLVNMVRREAKGRLPVSYLITRIRDMAGGQSANAAVSAAARPVPRSGQMNGRSQKRQEARAKWAALLERQKGGDADQVIDVTESTDRARSSDGTDNGDDDQTMVDLTLDSVQAESGPVEAPQVEAGLAEAIPGELDPTEPTPVDAETAEPAQMESESAEPTQMESESIEPAQATVEYTKAVGLVEHEQTTPGGIKTTGADAELIWLEVADAMDAVFPLASDELIKPLPMDSEPVKSTETDLEPADRTEVAPEQIEPPEVEPEPVEAPSVDAEPGQSVDTQVESGPAEPASIEGERAESVSVAPDPLVAEPRVEPGLVGDDVEVVMFESLSVPSSPSITEEEHLKMFMTDSVSLDCPVTVIDPIDGVGEDDVLVLDDDKGPKDDIDAVGVVWSDPPNPPVGSKCATPIESAEPAEGASVDEPTELVAETVSEAMCIPDGDVHSIRPGMLDDMFGDIEMADDSRLDPTTDLVQPDDPVEPSVDPTVQLTVEAVATALPIEDDVAAALSAADWVENSCRDWVFYNPVGDVGPVIKGDERPDFFSPSPSSSLSLMSVDSARSVDNYPEPGPGSACEGGSKKWVFYKSDDQPTGTVPPLSPSASTPAVFVDGKRVSPGLDPALEHALDDTLEDGDLARQVSMVNGGDW